MSNKRRFEIGDVVNRYTIMSNEGSDSRGNVVYGVRHFCGDALTRTAQTIKSTHRGCDRINRSFWGEDVDEVNVVEVKPSLWQCIKNLFT